MKAAEIAEFVTTRVDPLPDSIWGNRYRAAAYLLDGTYLPCVVFQSQKKCLELFARRMKELRWEPKQKTMVTAGFVCGGSRLAHYHIGSIQESPFAWPQTTLKMIHGETAMGWTAFVAEMRDGTMHSYGTSFAFEFFDLPNGYAVDDIVKIHSGMVYSPSRGLEKFSIDSVKVNPPLREKPFFTCYLDVLG